MTLECHVDSATTPEVMWYKDNLPLNSPDYETRYDRGVATLTIEETFSEDTARYTVRLTNEAGTAESSAYLHVRGQYRCSWYQSFVHIVLNIIYMIHITKQCARLTVVN